MFNGTDLIANPLELKEGDVLQNVQIVLAKGVGMIKGKVSDGETFGDSMFGGYSLLTMYYPNALKTDKAEIINVTLGQEQSEINVTIPDRDLYTVEGKIVTAKDKMPVKNAKVYLKRDGDNTFSIFDEYSKRQQSGSTDERGNWSFKEIPKGTYTLVVEPPDNLYDTEEGGYIGNQMPNRPPKPKLAKKTQEITIESQNLSEIIVEIGYGATVSGTATLENSQEMPKSVNITASKDKEETATSTTIYNYSDMDRERGQKTNHEFTIEGVTAG